MLPEPSGKKTSPSRSHRVRSLSVPTAAVPSPVVRPTRYDTYREIAARSPCSFLVVRRRGTAGQLLLVSLSPCRSYSRNHSSRQTTAVETTAVHQPLLQAYQSAGGTSCRPLVCLCYTRVAMHGRSFQSARVIVVVLPLPSLLDVFPSVEPTTIVNICIQLAGFEQNRYFEGKCIALLYILRIVMLLFFSATLEGRLHWRDTRAAACLLYTSPSPRD